MMFRRIFGKRNRPTAENGGGNPGGNSKGKKPLDSPILNDPRIIREANLFIEEMHAKTGIATRAAELPGWALIFRSPFKTYGPATSWLGGLPKAPASFVWPNGINGLPLTFIAQIDLAALAPEPQSQETAPGLPSEGALLVFMGDGYAIRILTEDDMRSAAPVPQAANAPDIDDLGYWGQGDGFNQWAVDPVPYKSVAEERPDILPDPFERPEQWIVNWGMALFEVDMLLEKLTLEKRFSDDFMTYRGGQLAKGMPLVNKPVFEKKLAHHHFWENHFVDLMAVLSAWRDRATAEAPETPIDQAALQEVFEKRMIVHDAMKENHGTKHLLPGLAHPLWVTLLKRVPQIDGSFDFSVIPPEFQQFIEANITNWRSHRLFGLEPAFPNNCEDFRGQDPFISIASDPLLGTESEHDYGFSVWLDREKMANGDHEDGQFVRHCAV